MALQDVETSWGQWRRVFGTPRSAQRRQLEAMLERKPVLLYWGDSWFTTPLYMNLALQSMRRIDGLAMLAGKPGALAAQLFDKRSVARTLGWLKTYPFDVLCVSAGGNDGLSERLAKIFPKKDAGRMSAEEAFDRVVDAGLFGTIAAHYHRLLDALEPLHRKRPAFRVVGHGYALVQRIGAKAKLTTGNIGLVATFKRDTGPWLWPPMKPVLGSMDEARRFAHLLMREGFRDLVLAALAHDYKGFFNYADFTDEPSAATDAFWNDEIHPTEQGFEAIAPALNAEIRKALPAAKRAAVS